MNLDLTPQIVRDFEKLREEAEKPKPPPVPPELIEELNRRHDQVAALQAENQKLLKEVDALQAGVKLEESAGAGLQEQLNLAIGRAEAAERNFADFQTRIAEADRGRLAVVNQLTESRERFAQQVKDEKEKFADKLEEAKKRAAEAIENREKELREEFARKLASARAASAKEAPAVPTVNQVEQIRDLNRRVMKAAAAPMKLRVLGLLIDLYFAIVAFQFLDGLSPEFRGFDEGRRVLAWCVLVSLRTFISPGNLLLGISARQVEADPRETRRAGLGPRFLCGVMHYGAFIATAVVDVTRGDARHLLELLPKNLLSGQADPVSAFRAMYGRDPEPLTMALLLGTAAWSAIVVISFLFSPLIHWSIPYLHNTTLVESLWRIGFRRFKAPLIEVPRDVAEV